MDELFDIFDVLSNLDDLTDLTDHADALLTALDGMDYIDLDASDLSMLDDLARFGADDFVGVGDAFDSGGDFVDLSDAFADPDLDLEYTEWHLLDDVADPSLFDDSADFTEFVAGEVDDYPEHLLDGVEEVSYDPLVNPENRGMMGEWRSYDDGTSEIRLFDHNDQIETTLHHELAHHLFDTHPGLVERIAVNMSDNPLLEHLEVNLDKYETSEQAEEFAADAFSYYKAKPELLHEIAPEIYETIASWWRSQGAVT